MAPTVATAGLLSARPLPYRLILPALRSSRLLVGDSFFIHFPRGVPASLGIVHGCAVYGAAAVQSANSSHWPMGVSVTWWRFVPSTRTIQISTLCDALPEKTIHSPSGDQLPLNADLRLSEMISIVLISPPSTGTRRRFSPSSPKSDRIVLPSGDQRPGPSRRSLSARAPLPSTFMIIRVVSDSSASRWRVKT